MADPIALDPGGEPPIPATPASPVKLSKAYRNYAIIMLMLIYTLNFLDRQIVNILAEPIKNELDISDTQLGMLTGLAFAVFYTFLGIPIARLAEHKNRGVIISASLAAWSGFTALCGTAQNFVQLCLFRIGVGVGEAGCTPPAFSLITDYVPKEKRASALSFYSMGVPLGSLLGMAMGGIVADAYGWRVAFFVAGAPGLVFALIGFLTLKETRSAVKADMAAAKANRGTFKETMAVLVTKRTFWLLAFGSALKAFIGYGQAPFTASFFLRNHTDEVTQLAANFSGMWNNIFGTSIALKSVGFLGLVLGILSGVLGAISTNLGGWISDKAAVKDQRNILVAPAIALVAAVPVYIMAINAPTVVSALALLCIPSLLYYFWYGPVYATTQGIVPAHMRATASAILLFIINIIGLGLGPMVVGLISDTSANFMLSDSGLNIDTCKTAVDAAKATCTEAIGEGVRWALMISACFGLISFVLFWMARKTIREEMVS